MSALDKHISQIKHVCNDHAVKSLFVFGSILTDRFNADSDVDFIVDIDSSNPLDYTDHYFALKSELEKIFKKPVDLLEEKALKNPFFKKQIEHTKVLVYGR